MHNTTSARTARDDEVAYFAELVRQRPDVALCRATSAVSRSIELNFAERDFGVGEHLVLSVLEAVGPVSQRSLTTRLRIDRTAMVGLVDSLESAGFARRERDPDDRRAYRVTITENGRAALAAADDVVPDAIRSAFAGLSAKERTELSRLLSRLLVPR